MKRARLAFLLAAAPLLAGDGPQVLPLRTQLSAETAKLPGGETMGLLGLTTTTDLGPFYIGAGLYGAARGQRGGFFNYGLEGGLRGRPFGSLPVEFDAGLYMGGGGGASAPQGQGLMLRPHVGAALVLGRLRFGAQLSQVRFPHGGFDSTEAAFTIAYTADHLWKPAGGWDGSFSGPVSWSGRELEGEVISLHPGDGALTRSGTRQAAFDLAGFRLTTDLGGPFFRYLEVDAAARGHSAGYSQAFAGLGAAANLQGPLGVEARLGAGLGGGGGVDTGGGLLLSGEGAITLGTHGWRASMGFGYMKAPGGKLEGRTLALRLAHRFEVPTPALDGAALATFDFADWRMGAGALIFRRALRKDGSDGTMQEMTLRADRMLDDGFYLSGEAGSATGGGAGGYSTGLAGLGWETPALLGQRLFLEIALGAGGGGGILTSTRAGWRTALPFGFGLDASIGKAHAAKGGLDSPTYGLGLHYRFSALERAY